MKERPKRPSVVFYVCVTFSLAVLYFLSFGPACWLFWQADVRELLPAFRLFYYPVEYLYLDGPGWFWDWTNWYVPLFGVTREQMWWIMHAGHAGP
jgi:hypothetical protein